jgi:hypothetical protein
MNGSLAQLIALTSYGNAFLTNWEAEDGFYPGNSTFQYCNLIAFEVPKRLFFFTRPKVRFVASNPLEWFQHLKNEGIENLRLYYHHSDGQSLSLDHKLAGFVGGGGTWLIEAIKNHRSDFWNNRWNVTKEKDPDSKIWAVNYRRTTAGMVSPNHKLDLGEEKANLNATLTQLISFTERTELEFWNTTFKKAHAALTSDTPAAGFYHEDMLPADGYSLSSRQLIFSAGWSFVFGGMGSWNDQSFSEKEDSDEYEALSSQLYDRVNAAILVGVNSF